MNVILKSGSDFNNMLIKHKAQRTLFHHMGLFGYMQMSAEQL